MTDVPTLHSERLLLRPHRLDDFERLAAMWANPQVVTYFGGKPFEREDSWGRLLRYAGHWALMGYGMWAVTIAGSDAHVGDVGFLHGERTGVPPFGCPEAGWTFHPEAQGQGYASEAVATILKWGDERFDRTVAMIHPGNAPSIAVARRNGFSIFGESTYKNQPTGLWERIRTNP